MIGNRMVAVRPFRATFWLERKHEKQKAAGGVGAGGSDTLFQWFWPTRAGGSAPPIPV